MNNKKILIVDNNTDILNMVRLGIKVYYPEAHVELANNGLAALCQLQKKEDTPAFDIILTDYEMPIINGLALAQTIRSALPDTRLILMTAYPIFDKQQRQAIALNFDDFIEKPFTITQLMNVLQPEALPC